MDARQADGMRERPPLSECEIKLDAPRPLLREAARRLGLLDAPARSLRAVYYDAPDRALEQARMSLRARSAEGAWTTTFKWPRKGDGLFVHGEAEAQGSPPQGNAAPDLSALDPQALSLLENVTDAQALAPRFETRVRRRVALIEREGARIEAAFDEGFLLVGKRRAPIAEIELEWISGPPQGLYALAREIVDAGLRIAPLAKSARGYLLAAGETPAPVRASPLALDADMRAEDALAGVVETTLAQFLANMPALAGAHSMEAAHQMRVALRRLRAGLALFDKRAPEAGLRRFRQEAGELARALGPARDWDVFLAGLEDAPFAAADAEYGLIALRARAMRRRAQAHGEARAVAQSAQASIFALDLQAFAAARGWRADPQGALWRDESARAFALARLAELDKRARKRGKGLRRLDAAGRHRLRIALKNLRYAAEFFAPALAPDDLRPLLKPTTRLLDMLGAAKDAVAAARLAASLGRKAGPHLARAIGLAQGWSLRAAGAGDERLRKRFAKLHAAPRPWS
jgi:inorganic triphosphatase YgiF